MRFAKPRFYKSTSISCGHLDELVLKLSIFDCFIFTPHHVNVISVAKRSVPIKVGKVGTIPGNQVRIPLVYYNEL